MTNLSVSYLHELLFACEIIVGRSRNRSPAWCYGRFRRRMRLSRLFDAVKFSNDGFCCVWIAVIHVICLEMFKLVEDKKNWEALPTASNTSLLVVGKRPFNRSHLSFKVSLDSCQSYSLLCIISCQMYRAPYVGVLHTRLSYSHRRRHFWIISCRRAPDDTVPLDARLCIDIFATSTAVCHWTHSIFFACRLMYSLASWTDILHT